MKSFYYCESWKELMNSDKNGIYYKNYVPIISHISKSFTTSNLIYTYVDKDYSAIKDLIASKTYKSRIEITNCPKEVSEYLELAGFTKTKWATSIIDLSLSEEELWGNVKKEAKKIVNRTKKEGCYLYICQSDNDFKEYYKLLKKARAELKFRTPPYIVLKKQWEIMHPKNYEVFLVKDKEGRILAGMGIVFTQDYMVEVAAGRSSISKNKNIYANDLLKWEIIAWGKNKKIKYYDLAGIHPNPEEDTKEYNIRRFKEKWGGFFAEISIFEKYREENLIAKIIRIVEKTVKRQKK